MKILWFTNIPMPEMLGKKNTDHSGSGGWMLALLDQLCKLPNLKLTVVNIASGIQACDIISESGVRMIAIPQSSRRRIFQFRNPDDNPKWVKVCNQIIKSIEPDIIHIHGTERFYGLIGMEDSISAPIVISLQGLLHEFSKYRYYFGATPFKDLLLSHHFLYTILGIGPFFSFLRARRSARREITILRENRWFMGRTYWDYSHLKALNPRAQYFDVAEMLRASFYQAEWNIQTCIPHRIAITNAKSFSRGIEVVLEAAVLLKSEFPDLSIYLPGVSEKSPFGVYLRGKIAKFGLQNIIESPGAISENKMVDGLLHAHVFVIASLLENSPNSLCEAQLVGLPCVASYAGGIPSLVQEGETGLLFPPGDAAVLAAKIRDIFVNDNLAMRLGANARKKALERHDPVSTVEKVMQVYTTVIQEFCVGLENEESVIA